MTMTGLPVSTHKRKKTTPGGVIILITGIHTLHSVKIWKEKFKLSESQVLLAGKKRTNSF